MSAAQASSYADLAPARALSSTGKFLRLGNKMTAGKTVRIARNIGMERRAEN